MFVFPVNYTTSEMWIFRATQAFIYDIYKRSRILRKAWFVVNTDTRKYNQTFKAFAVKEDRWYLLNQILRKTLMS